MAHVLDQWTRPNPATGRRVRSERWGRGLRWLARWETGEGRASQAFATRDEAEGYLAKIRTGAIPVRKRDAVPTVEQWGKVWQSAQVHHRESTGGSVAQYLGRINQVLGDRRIDELTRSEIQDMVAGWKGTYAPATIRSTYSALTGAMKLAVHDGLLSTNPCAGVRLPKIEREKVVPLTAEQVQQIAARVPDHYRAMVWVAAASGMRGGELRGLTADRIAGQVVKVDRQLTGRDGKTPVFGPPKSKAGVRNVDLGEVATEQLRDHMGARGLGESGLVFTGRTGAPLRRADLSEVWRAATAGMGLRPRSGWHDLRHYHASLLIASGLSVRAVVRRRAALRCAHCGLRRCVGPRRPTRLSRLQWWGL